MRQARGGVAAMLVLAGLVVGLIQLLFASLVFQPPVTAQQPGTLRLLGRTMASSPGGVVTYTLTISNSTAAARTLSLAVGSHAWPLDFPPTITVPANTVAAVPVAASVPFALDGAGQDSATIILTPNIGNALTARLGSSTLGQASAAGYTGCRFDLDYSGAVGAADAAVAAARFGVAGSSGALEALADLNHDGRIGAADVQAVAGRSGRPCAVLPAADTTAIREAMTLDGVRRHLDRFQAIATANGGNRAVLRPGFDASVAYVRSQLETAGYSVTIQTFTLPRFEELEPSRLERLAPEPKVYTPTVEFGTFTNSASGEVTATLQAVDLVIPPGPMMNSSTSACEAADFTGFTRGNIALIQRGTCTFQQKVANAQTAGAAGVLFMNEGQAPGRTGVIVSSLNNQGVTVPVLGTSYALGAELAGLIAGAPAGVTLHMFTRVGLIDRPAYNVWADSPQGDDQRTIVVGGHLDSVTAGPGINDNGSGTATILELAIQMARLELAPKNRVRFAFWGAEELGLLGSSYYVDNLSPAARDAIWLNLNFDMLGSPNFARFIYDGDGSSTTRAGPLGSDEIEAMFERVFERRQLPAEPTAFDGRSDYGPFIAIGIPAGGLFTGAEGRKSAAQAALYGGTAAEPLDPCYHQACDTIDNIHPGVLDEMADAVADVVVGYAMDERRVLDRPRGATQSGSVDSNYDLDYKGPEVPMR